MRWPRFAVLVLIATLLQASWVKKIAVTHLNVTPDLLLIVMVFFAIRCNPTEAIISSFVLGFASDIVSAEFAMGTGTISFGLFGTALSYMHRVVTIRKILHEALAILAVGFGARGLACFLAILVGRPSGIGSLSSLAGILIYSSVVGPFLFLLFDWSMGIRNRRRTPGRVFWHRKK